MNLRVVLCALLLASPVAAQSVQQSGTVTRGHVAVWNTSGVIADGGSSASSPISSIGVTNNGGAGICVNSALPTSPGWNSLCLGAATSGPAIISLQNFGTAPAESVVFDINGNTQGFPTVTPLPVVIGNIACFSNTSGALTDCGSAPSTVPLVVGTTPIGNGTSGAPLFDNSGILGNGSVSSIWSAFTQAGTNAVTRTVQNKLAEWLSVADFATPQDAINRAIATGSNTVWFPCGTYSLSTSLILNNALQAVRLTGPGGSTQGGCAEIISTASSIISAQSANAPEIDHLYILGNKPGGGQTAIDFSHGTSGNDAETPKVHDNLIEIQFANAANIGIDLDESESAFIWNNFIGVNNSTPGVAGGACAISGVRAAGHYAVSATIGPQNVFSSGGATVLCSPGAGFNLRDNTIEGDSLVVTPGPTGTCNVLNISGNWIGDYSAGFTLIDSNCTNTNSKGNVYANGTAGGINIKQENSTGTAFSDGDLHEGQNAFALGTGNTAILQNPTLSLSGTTATGTPATTLVQYLYGSQLITSAGSQAFVVGANGATNPAFSVDASTASSATGINIKSAAAGGGVAISVTSPNSGEGFLTIDAKGGGGIEIGGTSTGGVVLPHLTTFGLGGAGGILGQAAFVNSTSGSITLQPPTGALGTITLTLPTTTGTLADGASSPLVLNATTGNLTCPTCATTSGGGTISTLTFGTHLVSGGTSYNGSAGVTITSDATAVNTASTIMARDGSGQVAATTFTGALTGHGSLDLALTGGTMSGNIAMGGNQINNVIIGTTTPLAGAFTTLTATTLANVATSSALCYNVGTGALTYDGTIGTCTVSDERLKNMGPRIDHALDKLLRINGVSYTWKDPARGSGPQIGVGAQTVEKVFPELVQTGSDGIKSVDYQRLTAPIIEALRELKADNDDLKTEMKKLKHGFHQRPL